MKTMVEVAGWTWGIADRIQRHVDLSTANATPVPVFSISAIIFGRISQVNRPARDGEGRKPTPQRLKGNFVAEKKNNNDRLLHQALLRESSCFCCILSVRLLKKEK